MRMAIANGQQMQEVDDGDERENLQRAEGRRGQLHAAPGDLADRDDRAKGREFDELHEIRCQWRQGHTDCLRQHDAAERLQRCQPKHRCRLTMALRHRLDASPIDLGDEGGLVDRQADDECGEGADADPEHDRQHVIDPQQLHQDRCVADDLSERHAEPAQRTPARHVEAGDEAGRRAWPAPGSRPTGTTSSAGPTSRKSRLFHTVSQRKR